MSLWKRATNTIQKEQIMVQFYDEKGLLDLRICLAPWIEDRILADHSRQSQQNTDSYETLAVKFHEDLQKKLIAARADNLLKFKAIELCTLINQLSPLELYTNLLEGLRREVQVVSDITQMPLNPYMTNASCVGMLSTASSMSNNSGGVGGGLGGMDIGTSNHLLNNGGHMPNLLPNTGAGSIGGGMGGIIGGCGGGGGGGGGGGAGAAGVGAMNVAGGIVNNSNMCNTDLFKVHHTIQRLLSEFEQLYQEIQLFLQDYQAFQSFFATNPNPLESGFEEQAKLLLQKKPVLIANMKRYNSTYEHMQDRVINELKNWRRQQALAGNGAPFHDNLDEIQRCFEMLELFVSKLLTCVRDMLMFRVGHDENEIKEFQELMTNVQRAQKSLVLSAFIVEKQPPQVMKTNTRFAAAVRWLIGSQLGVHMNPPTVECIILSEAQALRFVSQRTIGDASGSNPAAQCSGEIQNNVSNMEYQQNTRVFSASFRNMQLKKIKRAEKKGTESVMDEKFALLFYAVTTVNDYQIRVWTLSLPVVVIVHGNQEPQSWATITWDNAFADVMRDPFMVTDRVTWCQLSAALNTKFGSATGRILTTENIEFLYEKLVRTDTIVGDHSELISWSQFCKEPLPDRTFTFWDWFFAIMKLTKDHLLGLWKAGRVTGFINKRKAQEDLLRSNTGIGTFLLRFSDSEQGGITVAFVNEDGQVLMLQPWTARDLNIRNLADRIHDLEILRYLHPTDSSMIVMGRDEAFGEFYTQRQEPAQRGDGYVPSEIKVRVPASENGSLSGNTPHHIMQSPHHPHQDNMPMATENGFQLTEFDSMFCN